MAKKEIRSIKASEGVAGLIDHGYDVDVQIKNLTMEDKGIKSKLTASVDDEFQQGESSLRMDGTRASAVVTMAEKLTPDSSLPGWGDVVKAVDAGLLDGILEKRRQ